MKPETRFLGVDDGPFTWADTRVPVAAVVTRGALALENVFRFDVAVDGDDATAELAALLAREAPARDVAAIFVDGIAVGGFNVLDLGALHDAARVPVVAVTRGAPDLAAMRVALFAHQPSREIAERKWRLIAAQPARLIATRGELVAVTARGATEKDVDALLAAATARGLVPEPLRLAHLIARVLSKDSPRTPSARGGP
ncbi:MAG: endonuclease dU [Thermoplasmatota archaeon]